MNVALVYVLFNKGFSKSLTSSTLNDLRERFDTDAAGISYALSIASVGAIIGALCSTVLDRQATFLEYPLRFMTSL